MLCAEDYRTIAQSQVSPEIWDFVDGGSGTELTLAANDRAFSQIAFRPRVLVDVSVVDTATTLLGAAVPSPVVIAPTAYHQLCHPDGEVATAAGARGNLYVVSIFSSQPLEEIARAATGPLWLQLYWLKDRGALAALAQRAEAAGFRALVLTVDAPRIGKRLRDLRNGWAIPEGIEAVNLDAALMGSAHISKQGSSGLAVHAAEAFDQTITWADLEWLRGVTSLPIVLKGILTAEDALLAAEHGVSAVVASNHGGRQLDPAVTGLHALPEIAEAVAGRCQVMVDGGVRRGSDVFAGLALGADAVLLGRPVLWGLAARGAHGVGGVMDLITSELEHTMALTGRVSIAGIDRTAVA
ncbi:alpha-hydroxy acid oxidase [Longispora albida]|uniref:alpha-hydroxy acid oxidase n=1 Tax=Longispora albida TaxID=203523 RepID=UPI00036B4940|nr:alpha-hydroxy acid oxidase [Longispora albida]